MNPSNKLPLFFLLFLITAQCFAWGQIGHDTTCSIAERHLTHHARKKITKVLDGQSIVYWSNWLDNASHQPEYEYSSTWHYKNINEDVTFDTAPAFEKGDIITAIHNLMDKISSGELSHEEEALSLKMLIHLVGDLHQPLHFGHKDDLGGNKRNVRFFKENNNLHTVWDTNLVEAGHRWTYTEWTNQLDRLNKKQQASITYGTIEDWARETHAICTEIYATTPEGTNISYDYVAKWTPVVEEQFIRGGLRLAKILNELY